MTILRCYFALVVPLTKIPARGTSPYGQRHIYPGMLDQKKEEEHEGGQAGEAGILLIEHAWEKSYLKAQQSTVEWVPFLLSGSTTSYAEIHVASHHKRVCADQKGLDQKEVFFYEVYVHIHYPLGNECGPA